ncbi:M4 family metallopeptidase [Kitasatospora sp. NPDC096077]|uniref:M4 family metallopeptidase n=1 Tax=Kitasatospora sp. NPDC096077 TaxID=3155544 RepID=UPI00331A8F30
MHHRSRPTAGLLGTGAALSLALALTVTVSPALAAPPGPSAEPDPVPALVAGEGTEAPQLVTGLSEAAPGGPAEAARAFLAAHADRFRVDPARLTEVAVERTGQDRHTVRFQQDHGGVPVLGGQYLVRLVGEGADQRVESVGGRYFTGLTAPTKPVAPAAELRRQALDAVQDPRARAGAAVEDRGPVVLPGGAGRLAQHFSVRADDAAGGGPLVHDVYVDATTGVVALAQESSTPYRVGGTDTPAATGPAAVPAVGSAPDLHGRTVPVNVSRQPDGSYQLVDTTRSAGILTYDGGGRDFTEFGGGIPDGILPVSSPGPDFPASAGSSGATDAHVNAAAVYDFYRNRLGRDGLDGKGSPILSVVNVTDHGRPFVNAAWGGRTMVYGAGDDLHLPFSAAMDVAGHEMTHGVVEHTANLVNIGQSGAMNEGIADYFGNAVEVTAHGVKMDDPTAPLMGESLCRTGTPQECATRNLDNRHTTVNDYLGAGKEFDNGGVHANSTIFSGALWDIRRTLDPLTADRLVYRALAEYLTPLDDFVAGRNAVLAAGKSLKLSAADLRKVAAAFDAHGIKAGWQSRVGTDSRTLMPGGTAPLGPVTGGGHWVMGSVLPNDKGIALYTGSTTGTGTPVRLSPDDGRTHGWAATDGKSAVWLAVGPDSTGTWGIAVVTAPLTGGPLRTLFQGLHGSLANLRMSGGDIAFTLTDNATDQTRVYLSHDGAAPTQLPLPEGHNVSSSLAFRDGRLGWIETWSADGATVQAPTVYSTATGKATAQYPVSTPQDGAKPYLGSPVLAGDRLLWLAAPADRTLPTALRSGALDGSGVTDLLPADSRYSLTEREFTASDQAVSYVHRSPEPTTGWSNAALPKLYQLPLTGGTPVRVSCNRGGQYHPVADQGTRVLWLDGTVGRNDLVVRDKPAGSC